MPYKIVHTIQDCQVTSVSDITETIHDVCMFFRGLRTCMMLHLSVVW